MVPFSIPLAISNVAALLLPLVFCLNFGYDFYVVGQMDHYWIQ